MNEIEEKDEDPEENNADIELENAAPHFQKASDSLPTESSFYSFLYNHGFVTGVLKLEPEIFSQYITSLRLGKLAKEKMEDIRSEIGAKEREFDKTKAELTVLENTVIQCKNEIDFIQWEVEELKNKKEQSERESQKLEAEINKINPYSSRLVAFIFILSGLIFITADVLITKGIFFKALNMPSIEAWILAIGLSFIAFIIKPAVDRVFEEPYLSGKNKKLNHSFLLSVGSIALISLGFLGYYRNIAYKFEKQISGLSEQRKLLKEQNFGELTDKVVDLNTQIQQLGIDQLDHWTILAVFTISSIVFALAGAICFSIGLPLYKSLREKGRLAKLIKSAIVNVEKTNSHIGTSYSLLSTKLTEKEQAETRIKRLPDLLELRSEIATLKKDALDLLEEHAMHLKESQKNWHLEGFQRGQVYKLTEDLVVTPLRFETIVNGSQKTVGRRTISTPSSKPRKPLERDYGNYLHQQLRSIIDYNFNKKQQNGNGHDE